MLHCIIAATRSILSRLTWRVLNTDPRRDRYGARSRHRAQPFMSYDCDMCKPIARAALLATFLSALISAAPKTEIGSINSAAFRIDVPENWNGSVVVYCHGYAAEPVKYDAKPIAPF